MCDDDVHQGLTSDPGLSRRAFGLAASAAASLSAVSAHAQAQVVEREVEVKTADGAADAALFHPAGKGPWPAVLVWPDILGLRPVFRDMGRRVAAQGYVVLVPNAFYRTRRAPVIQGPFDFNKPDDRAKVMALAATLTPEGTTGDGVAFVAFLDAQPQTDKTAKAGVHGYCMGGPLSLRTAAAASGRIGAMATFHGANMVTDKPDSPHLLIARMKASEVYCAVADNDDQRDPKAKAMLKSAFDAAHIPARVEVYHGSDHGWCVKGTPVYDDAAAERAFAELTALYRRRLV